MTPAWGLRAAVLALAAVPLLTAGCSSASSSPTTSRPSSTPTTSYRNTACGLVTTGDIRKSLGMTVDSPGAHVVGSVTTCTYRAQPISRSVVITYDTTASPASFTANRQAFVNRHESVQALSSLGDEAFLASLSTGGSTLSTVVARQGTTVVAASSTASSKAVAAFVADILSGISTAEGTTTTTG